MWEVNLPRGPIGAVSFRARERICEAIPQFLRSFVRVRGAVCPRTTDAKAILQIRCTPLVELELRLRQDGCPIADAAFDHTAEESRRLLFGPFTYVLTRAASAFRRERLVGILSGFLRLDWFDVWFLPANSVTLVLVRGLLYHGRIEDLLYASLAPFALAICSRLLRQQSGLHHRILPGGFAQQPSDRVIYGREEGGVGRRFTETVDDGERTERPPGSLFLLCLGDGQLEVLAEGISLDIQAATFTTGSVIVKRVWEPLERAGIDKAR
jgi:hypothetical protein